MTTSAAREPGEVLALDRRHERVGGVGAGLEVEGVEGLEARGLEAVADRVLAQGRVAVLVEVEVERGVVEHLVGDAVPAVVPGHGGDGRDERAARAVAGDRQGRAGLEGLPHPAHDAVAVLQPGGVRRLGGAAVADRHDLEPGRLREGTRDVVVRLEAAEEEGAAVEVDEHAGCRLGGRRVDAHRHVAVRRGRRRVLDRVERQPLLEGRDVRLLVGPHRGRVERTGRWRGQGGEDPGDLGVQRHQTADSCCWDCGFWPGKTSLISSSDQPWREILCSSSVTGLRAAW